VTCVDNAGSTRTDCTPATPNAVQNNSDNTYSGGNQNLASATHLEIPSSSSAAPTTQGDIQYNTTQQRPVIGEYSQTSGLVRTICFVGSPGGNGAANNMISADGGTYNTLVSTAAFSSAVAFNTTCTIPAGLLTTNKRLRVTATFISTSTNVTQTLTIKLGGTAVLAGATSSAGSLTNGTGAVQFYLDGTAAASGSAAVEAFGISCPILATQCVKNSIFPPASVATNGALVLSILGQFSANTAGNMTQLRSLLVEVIN
jgi:hypothetical protein